MLGLSSFTNRNLNLDKRDFTRSTVLIVVDWPPVAIAPKPGASTARAKASDLRPSVLAAAQIQGFAEVVCRTTPGGHLHMAEGSVFPLYVGLFLVLELGYTPVKLQKKTVSKAPFSI